jgi:hypothetical protein
MTSHIPVLTHRIKGPDTLAKGKVSGSRSLGTKMSYPPNIVQSQR